MTTARPDRIGVLLDGKVALRVTNDWKILLNKDLTKQELRDTVAELARGISIVHSTVLNALVAAYGYDISPNGGCACPSCNLIRLRDALSEPTLN